MKKWSSSEIKEIIRKSFLNRLKEPIIFFFSKEKGKMYKLHVKDIHISHSDDLEHSENNNWSRLKEAIENEETWTLPATFHIEIRDENDKKIAEFQKRAHIPFHNFLDSFLIKGKFYIPVSQVRRLPGFYVVKRENRYIGLFNIANKKNIKLVLDPDGKSYFVLGTKKVFLKDLDDVLGWKLDYGKFKELQPNSRPHEKERSILKFAEFFLNKKYNNIDDAIDDLKYYFKDAQIYHDGLKTHKDLPDKLNFDTLKHFAQYFLDVANNKKDTIETNDLRFKEILNAYELMAERLKYDLREGRNGRLLRKHLLTDGKVRPEKLNFTTPILTTFRGTGLIFASQKVNPLDFMNNFYKVIYTGEGGIKNTQNTDDQLRLIHDTDFGILDLYFSPSSQKIGLVKYFTYDFDVLNKEFNVIDKNGMERKISHEEFMKSNIAHIRDKIENNQSKNE